MIGKIRKDGIDEDGEIVEVGTFAKDDDGQTDNSEEELHNSDNCSTETE